MKIVFIFSFIFDSVAWVLFFCLYFGGFLEYSVVGCVLGVYFKFCFGDYIVFSLVIL